MKYKIYFNQYLKTVIIHMYKPRSVKDLTKERKKFNSVIFMKKLMNRRRKLIQLYNRLRISKMRWVKK